MPRLLLDENRIDTAIREVVAGHQRALVQQVQQAVESHPVVVVGMAQNPFVKRARRALDRAGIPFQYIERGSYFSAWRERLALKMWSGWPTFPMVFVQGSLVGGANDLQRLIDSGALRQRLAAGAPAA